MGEIEILENGRHKVIESPLELKGPLCSEHCGPFFDMGCARRRHEAVTLAIEAGVSDKVWCIADVVALLDA